MGGVYLSRAVRPTMGTGNFRGIVLVRPDEALPEKLLNLFRGRGWLIRVVSSPAEVMVELALGGGGVVIVNLGAYYYEWNELEAAIKRYYSRAICWQYDEIGRWGKAGLTKLAAGRMGAPQTSPSSAETSRPRKQADLQGWNLPGRSNNGSGEPLVTEEELAMLLDESFQSKGLPSPPRGYVVDGSSGF